MHSRVQELYYEYCVPKPSYFFRIYDTQKEEYPLEESEQAQQEINSIDIYVNLVI